MMRRLFFLVATVLFVLVFFFRGDPRACAGAALGLYLAAGLVLLVTALVKPDVGNGD